MTVTLEPGRHQAVVFDLDGVITDTARVHEAAWKQLFDSCLSDRTPSEDEAHGPFTQDDYRRYVDGKPRYEGVDSFLRARGIRLPWGDPHDPSDRETVCGLGNRKNDYFQERLEEDGVDVLDDGVDLVRRAQAAGLGTAVFSSSRNCRQVLEAAGLADLFEVRVDGVVDDELGLPGKPAPDVLVEAARRVGAQPHATVVIEDAEAGVEAGRRGGFALVVGIDRGGAAERLRAGGADVVVEDLGDVRIARTSQQGGDEQ